MQQSLTRDILLKQKPLFENLVKQRFVYAQSFEIYGGVKGLYDYGPVGCAIKNNIQRIWREWFVIEDDMHEISCSCLTPHIVLKNSGHVERFADLMCRDLETKECFRADHLLEDFVETKLNDKKTTPELKEELELLRRTIENLTAAEMTEVFKKYDIRAPLTKNAISDPAPFNLMFQTHIGPWGDNVAYLRPETAQSLIVNFKKLLGYNNGKLPFAAANIGLGFRNEIAPRNGLLRVREFEMGEIEHFYDPTDSTYPRYHTIEDTVIRMWSASRQEAGEEPVAITIKEAMDTGVLTNQTLAYYIARTYLFMKEIGINEEGIRFRQHKAKEMAHYASDCWDCELLNSFGWVECVGLADRSAYDLNCHSKGIGKELNATRLLDKPRPEERIKIIMNKGPLGKSFKQDAKLIFNHVDAFDNTQKKYFMDTINSGEAYTFEEEGKSFELTKEHILEFKVNTVNVIEETFIPAIVEPAFGFGRVAYTLLEHCFVARDEKRTFLNLKPDIAPTKCSILPLMSKPEFLQFVAEIEKNLKKNKVSTRIDASGQTIGRRYARTDEIGIPFGITIDGDTVEKGLVTLRECLTMKQVQLPISEVTLVVAQLCNNLLSWEDVLGKYPLFESKEEQD